MSEMDPIIGHYESIREEDRLARGLRQLELVRTQQILRRHLPDPPARVLDVGGGTGVHAAWLAAAGYRVHVIDVTPRHIETIETQLGRHGVTAEIGDARALDRQDASAEAVLLLGPLYHLQSRADRLEALGEARRVVAPGGLVAVAAISRFASLFDGLVRGFLFDADFRKVVLADLKDGRHENPEGRPHWFTTAYFHRPDELGSEIIDSGLELIEVAGVEGLAGWLPHLEDRWSAEEDRNVILEAARLVEAEPSLLGLSAHLLAIARHQP